MERRARMGATKKLVVALLLCCVAMAAQTTGKTVRHHSVPADVPASDLTAAEAAIEKQDFADAEALLNKAVAADPANYVAWFDLGFVCNALGKSDESIAAYRKSVAAKPDVFESNLNLGLMLVRTSQPDAEKYLRAATTLTPTSHVDE